jgi:hypothetical protein
MKHFISTMLFATVAVILPACSSPTPTSGAGGDDAGCATSGTGGEPTSTSDTTSTSGAGGACEPPEASAPHCDADAQCIYDSECADPGFWCNHYVGEGACVTSEGCGAGQCVVQGDEGAPCGAYYECLVGCGVFCDETTGTCQIQVPMAHDACQQ